jgi:hypothetical protein
MSVQGSFATPLRYQFIVFSNRTLHLNFFYIKLFPFMVLLNCYQIFLVLLSALRFSQYLFRYGSEGPPGKTAPAPARQD